MKVELVDVPSGMTLRVSSRSPGVQAVQIYAPPERPVVVIEPQFNWADPFGAVWGESSGKGMAVLEPGGCVSYCADVAVSAIQPMSADASAQSRGVFR